MKWLSNRVNILSVLVFFVCFQIASSALAYDKYQDELITGTDMIADVLIARPVGNLALIIGTVGFIVSLPFTIPSNGVKDSYKQMIVKPARYSWMRPVGDYQNY